MLPEKIDGQDEGAIRLGLAVCPAAVARESLSPSRLSA